LSDAKRKFKPGSIPTIVMEDVVGKVPSVATIPELAESMDDFNKLTGLESVKTAIKEFLALAESNYKRELDGLPVDS